MLPLALALWGAATTTTTRQGEGHDAVIDTAPSAGSRTFYGLGGLSAGASTRMLLDYEPERRAEVLDLLFAPGVGFSFQILKLELGGDCQSSWGTEASHAHSANDTDPNRFERGYEWWLAKEAVKRNPQITLATLAWCAPPWITLGEADGYYSPAGLQYHLDFYKAARDVHHLNISYVGVWNESPWSSSYIKSLRHALDSAGFADTKIIAADQASFDVWSAKPGSKSRLHTDAAEGGMKTDKELYEAVGVIGLHHMHGKDTGPTSRGATPDDVRQQSARPLWASEDGLPADSFPFP